MMASSREGVLSSLSVLDANGEDLRPAREGLFGIPGRGPKDRRRAKEEETWPSASRVAFAFNTVGLKLRCRIAPLREGVGGGR
jgi:hypothetical protein